MPEHRIRFRGGWEWRSVVDDPDPASRLTLPLAWSAVFSGTIRLTRRFGRPTIDPADEVARLELRGVPGLQGLWLNGNDLGPIPDGVVDWDLPLDGLESRNLLSLDVIFPADRSAAWGAIAMVISTRSGDEA